jgi:hypothetical protein
MVFARGGSYAILRCIQFAPTIRAKTISADLTPLEASFSRTTCFIYRTHTCSETANFLFHAGICICNEKEEAKIALCERGSISFFSEMEQTLNCFQNKSGFVDFLFTFLIPNKQKKQTSLYFLSTSACSK